MHTPENWLENVIDIYWFDPLSRYTQFLLEFSHRWTQILVVSTYKQMPQAGPIQLVLVIHDGRICRVIWRCGVGYPAIELNSVIFENGGRHAIRSYLHDQAIACRCLQKVQYSKSRWDNHAGVNVEIIKKILVFLDNRSR